MSSKYFSKALLYDERKNILYSALAYMLVLSTNILAYFSSMPVTTSPTGLPIFESSDAGISVLFRMQYFPLFAICITTVFYSYINKEKKYAFMLSQPHGRDSFIFTKTLGFIISFTLPLLLYGVICIFLILGYNNLLDTNNYLFISLLGSKLISTFAVLTLAIAFMQLMQMLFGRNLNAFIFPIIIGFMWMIQILVINNFLSRKLTLLKEAFYRLFMFLTGPDRFVAYSGPDGSIEYVSLHFISKKYLNSPTLPVSLILILVSFSILYLCIILNRKIKCEDMDGIFTFSFSEVVFKITLSIFTVTTFTLLLSGVIYSMYSAFTGRAFSTELIRLYGLKGKESIFEYIFLVINISWVPLCILAYKLLGSILIRRRRPKNA